MARRPRQRQRATGGYYHVMNPGHNREVVFQTDDDHHLYFSTSSTSWPGTGSASPSGSILVQVDKA